MTREEAIKTLSHCIDEYRCEDGTYGHCEGCNQRIALDMAIEALSKMDAKENYWIGCESCDRAMEDGECELWDDRMTEECGAWR